jgi:hypothetical protein
MAVFCKRRRKFITPFIMALWVFAIFVSVAHACGLDEDFGHAGPNKTVNVSGHNSSENGGSPSCDKFCADDFPLLAKLEVVQDSPTGQALMGPPFVGESFQTTVAAVASLLLSPDLPPGIAVYIRFVRLAL